MGGQRGAEASTESAEDGRHGEGTARGTTADTTNHTTWPRLTQSSHRDVVAAAADTDAPPAAAATVDAAAPGPAWKQTMQFWLNGAPTPSARVLSFC